MTSQLTETSTTMGARVAAFIDIGTNSIRLLIVRIDSNASYTILTQLKETVRLGEGEFADHYLQPEAIDRAVLVCRQFASLARSSGAGEITAVATAATREAENQDEFLTRLREEAELDVRVISGLEEARLIYLGVASGVHLGDQEALFIDIGGGSTEVIIGTQRQHLYLNSLKLGAIRLASRFLTEIDGPVPSQTYSRLQRYVRHNMVHTLRELRTHRIDLAIGSSGTIENLADIAARMFLQRPLQPGDVLTDTHLKQVVQHLCALPLEERRKVPGLNPARADIIVAGAAIVDTLMQELALSELRITDRGLRDGLLVDCLMKAGQMPSVEEMSVRRRSVFNLGRACQFDEAHALTTAQLALGLCDSARIAKLHRFGAWERELLDYAALLHHIGAFLTYSNYQTHTHYLIRNAELLGFDQTEVAIMAAIALFHRKALPRKKHPEFAALDKESQQIVRILSLFLRFAESLDRSQSGNITHASFEAKSRKRVTLHVASTHDCHIEIWGVQKHLAEFDKVFGRTLEINVLEPEDATDSVAPTSL